MPDGRSNPSPEKRAKLREKSLARWDLARQIAKHYGGTPREVMDGVMRELQWEPNLLAIVALGEPWAVKKARNLVRGRKAAMTRFINGLKARGWPRRSLNG